MAPPPSAPETASALDRRNQEVYSDGGLVRFYGDRAFLYPAEEAILSRFETELRGARILDLGVGGGRTTVPLLALSSRYVGADYTAEMVEKSRARYPGVDFRHCDARDMKEFADGSFDFALFSANGIDHVVHQDRLAILREVHRVLAPGGLFVFSSHNLGWTGRRSPFDPRGTIVPRGTPRLWRLPLRARNYVAGVLNYRRSRRYERRGAGHAMLAYPIHQYQLVLYHTTPEEQRRQLESQGFGEVEAVDMAGAPIRLEAPPGDFFFHYMARKR
jgi:SAM-dependent methyltransferase